ncbi:DUF2254 family protein [Rhodococcus sp. CC-R104]|uniref:DUF2254 family protein n=1 Tax=Rhodococcus chondri TaxID=3065941 RepID=A0ABU7JR80_9NOCA|nr:DUF2254 family protein [Rhodococcus sp. CC-R104]MEE2032540.1 DUF2254 family protein [Rhodococcus sp. CC-R104]
MAVPACRDGWITQSPSEQILAALPPSTVARLETRPGAYIHKGEVLMRVRPTPRDAEKVRDRLEATVEISDSRTMQQDVDFALRQLVDVALRALSAAINDPTIAAEVVLRLGSVLRVLLTTESPSLSVCGAEDRVLQRPWILSADEYIEHAFEQIRQAGPTQLHVASTLARVLRMLVEHVRSAGRPEHIPALQHQLDMLVDAIEAQPGLHPEDVRRFRAVARSATDPAEHRIQ